MVHTADASTKSEENGSPTVFHSVKKNIPPASTATTNSGPSSSTEANERNLSSIRNSPRNTSDDDTGAVGGPVHRTLPGKFLSGALYLHIFFSTAKGSIQKEKQRIYLSKKKKKKQRILFLSPFHCSLILFIMCRLDQ